MVVKVNSNLLYFDYCVSINLGVLFCYKGQRERCRASTCRCVCSLQESDDKVRVTNSSIFILTNFVLEMK